MAILEVGTHRYKVTTEKVGDVWSALALRVVYMDGNDVIAPDGDGGISENGATEREAKERLRRRLEEQENQVKVADGL
jgi:hypothetical protein